MAKLTEAEKDEILREIDEREAYAKTWQGHIDAAGRALTKAGRALVRALQLTEVFTATPDEAITDRIGDALDIVCKLRRRGDTLVRADDLRNAMRYIELRHPDGEYGSVQFGECVDRLENALGGKRA